jgi:hypothetical protein
MFFSESINVIRQYYEQIKKGKLRYVMKLKHFLISIKWLRKEYFKDYFCIFVKALLPAFTPNKERIVITKYVALFS